jgi:hypothetical protein
MKYKLLTFLCCISGLFAQSEDQVSLRVDLVAWGNSISGLSLKTSSSENHTAFAFSYSKSIPYSGSAMMEIHQKGATVPEVPAGQKPPVIPPALLARRKESPTLVALAPIPAGARRVTILLAPAPGGVFEAYVINCDSAKVPVGKLSVLNLSPYKIAITVASDPQKRQLDRNAALVANPINQQVAYQLEYLDSEEWITQESNILPVSNEEQTLMIVLKNNSDLFRNSFGGTRGFLQLVTLRRGPNEAQDIVQITEQEKDNARKEADRINKEMDEAAKPQSNVTKPTK